MEIFMQPETWVALATLTFLEIILGVDNIIFISILSNKLPESQSGKARTIGLVLALALRIVLLFGINQLAHLEDDLFMVFDYGISGKDIILIAGGLFLIGKSTTEINHKMEGSHKEDDKKDKKGVSMAGVISQIIMMDVIFSIDSILTAVGLVDQLILMIIAVVIAMGVMIAFAGKISAFISKHPSLEMLALSFLILIGFMLALEGIDVHVEKKFIYFALFFSLGVEVLNMRFRKKSKQPVKLHKRISEDNIDAEG